MDLQDESALETMAMLPSTWVTWNPPGKTTQSTLQLLKGFPKEIAINEVEDKFLCEECSLILRHPMQSTCGHRFCRSCRDDMLSKKEPISCRTCLAEGVPREESFLHLSAMFEDKAAIREMKRIPVKCINQGCLWKGTFEQYSATHELECDKKLVNCSQCGVPVSQARITQHEQKQCPKRNVNCPHCNEVMVAELKEKHIQNICPNLPVNCLKCSKQVQKSLMKIHTEEDCPHRIVECPVPDCNAKLSFDLFPNHFIKTPQSTQKHLHYLFNKVKQLEVTIVQMEIETASTAGGATSGAVHSDAEPVYHSGTSDGRDEVAAGAEANVLPTEDRQKLKLHEDLMAVLHGEILRCIKQLEALNGQVIRESRNVKDVQKRLDNLEKSVGLFQGKLQEVIDKVGVEKDPKEYGTLTELLDSTAATWRIENFTQVRRAACNGSQPYISSPPFCTGPCGYKLRIRFFPDGDGAAKSKAFSVFIQLLKGPHDDLLPWPFVGKIHFILVDLKEFQQHRVVSFTTPPDQPAFQKPRTHNTPSGCLEFVDLKEFSNGLDKYLVNDTLFIKIYIQLSEHVKARIHNLNPKNMVGLAR